MKLKLTQGQRAEIIQLHKKCRERKHADKLKSILLLDDGFSCTDVGRFLLLDDDTVRKYRNQYLNQGATSLLTDNNKGTSSFLNPDQISFLELHLTNNVYLDSKGIVNWIETTFQIHYTPSFVPYGSKKGCIYICSLTYCLIMLEYLVRWYCLEGGRSPTGRQYHRKPP